MITKFKNWLKSLPTPASMWWSESDNYSMKKMATVGNATIWARITNTRWQEMQDFISENIFYGDERPTIQRMCLMPNVHSVYFEVMLDNNYGKRIGMKDLVDLSAGQEKSIQDHVQKVLLKKVEQRLDHYNQIM
jgi:hypothetical protein